MFNSHLVNPAGQADTSYALTFTAETATTDITFAGYQVPSWIYVTDISLTSGGGNLLGGTWTWTPAPSGSDTFTYNDGYGTGTPALAFGGVSVGSFDAYDQLVGTAAGQAYTLDFLFSNNESYSEPSGFVVSASNAVVGAPEPSSVVLLGLFLSGVGLLTRKRLAR